MTTPIIGYVRPRQTHVFGLMWPGFERQRPARVVFEETRLSSEALRAYVEEQYPDAMVCVHPPIPV